MTDDHRPARPPAAARARTPAAAAAWPGCCAAVPATPGGSGRRCSPCWPLTAALYTIGLSRSGWANDFYAAAVQAGTKSWKAFFFGSFDASNFITVDKTPASLWVMELSARAFGLNSWSLLLPQAAEGVATVGVLYATVRRWSGPAAGLIAATVMALTPVAALMFRFDNPDALLVLLMTAAAYATTRAIEAGRTRWLVLTGALLGFAFLTKMLQAFLVLPGVRAGLPGGRAAPAGQAAAAAARRRGGAGPRRGLVGGDRPAHPRGRPALHRRLDQQQRAAARARLQRPRQAGRQRDRLGRASAAAPGPRSAARRA